VKLSLSVRIAETPAKDRLTVEFEELAQLAVRHGYHAVCMRPSVVGVNAPERVRQTVRRALERLGLAISMATTDIAVPLNNEHGPDSLREMEPHLDVAEALGSSLIRVCMKNEQDIPWAQRAADQACERGIRLAHQCHTDSLFETVAGSIDVIKRVGRQNFGIIYEPANLMLCGEEYGPKAIKQLAPYIMNVYVQNHRINPTGKNSLQTRVHGEVRYDLTPLWEAVAKCPQCDKDVYVRIRRDGIKFLACSDYPNCKYTAMLSDHSAGVGFRDVFEGLDRIEYDGYVTVHQAFAELMGPAEAAERSAKFLRSVAKFDPPVGDKP
jgi:sugar phosphate isomerase/epimerase